MNPEPHYSKGRGWGGGRDSNIHLFLDEDGAFQVSVNLGTIPRVLQVDYEVFHDP